MEKTKLGRSRLERRTSKSIKINKSNKSANKKVARSKKRLSIFTLIGMLILIVLICFGLRWLVVKLKYDKYTDKMIHYGFNTLYDNKEATSTQNVLNGELVKVAIGSVTNTMDISSIYNVTNNNETDTKSWYNYSKDIGVNTVIDELELNKYATKIDAAILIVNTLESFQNIQIEKTKLNMSSKKLANYTNNQQDLIAKAVTLGIVPNNNLVFMSKKLIKGELNQMVVQVAEKYATMYYGNINGNGSTTVVTAEEKMPINYKDYPYIVDSVEKELYELKYNVRREATFKSPRESYNILGQLYGQIDHVLTRYLNKILNVNYETITSQDFLASIQNDVVYRLSESDVDQYVKYVKDNKIKLEGTARALLPIIYFNGVEYVIRTEITFKVLSANSRYNLLFGDENAKVKYESNEITMYVDVPMGMTMGSNSLLVHIDCLAKNLAKPTDLVAVEE